MLIAKSTFSSQKSNLNEEKILGAKSRCRGTAAFSLYSGPLLLEMAAAKFINHKVHLSRGRFGRS